MEHMLNVIGASLVAQTVKNLPECGRPGFDLWIGKVLGRSEWLPTPVFFPRKPPRTEEPGDYSPQGRKESDMPEAI